MRDVLGTGSKSTIAKFLREWKEKQGIESQAEGSIPTELLALVKGLWQHCQDKAEQHITEHQQATDKQLQASQQQLNEARQQYQLLQQQLQQREEALVQQSQTNQRLQSQLVDEQKTHVKQQERVAMLEQQLVQQTAETERLHQLLKHVQANLEHYQAAIREIPMTSCDSSFFFPLKCCPLHFFRRKFHDVSCFFITRYRDTGRYATSF